MKHSYLHGFASALLVVAVGCAGTGQASYSASATYTAPELILIEPDVQVVADYDEPVFYTDNYYWRQDNGVWYRSNNHLRGWVRYDAAPQRLRQIDRPARYVHYRGDARVVTAPQVRDHRDNQSPPPLQHQPTPTPPPMVQPTRPQPSPPVHDHRDHQPTPPPMAPPAQPRPPRDLREERKEDIKEIKEQRKEDKQDAKREDREDRKDLKKEQREDRKDAKQDFKQDKHDAKNGKH